MKKTKDFNLNKTYDKNQIKLLINWFLINYGSIRTLKLLEKLKVVGFEYATVAGISLGIEDLRIPKIKKLLFKNTEKEIIKNKNKYEKGKINIINHLEKITTIWNITNEILKNEVILNFRQTDLLNPLYMMAFSGARGNISQVRQLVGMRGLMADSKGEIINLPIKNNFKEGLNLTEYFISCYGARKGLVDTALKTANSGYLTRRLVYVVQSQTIKKQNCHTKNKRLILAIKNNKNEYKWTKEQLMGRVLAKDIIEKSTKKKIASFGQDICNYLIKKLIKIENIYIFSPLTCQLNTGFCQLCYGWNLGNGRMVELGESVGIIAAQSIGEPGTQLTMRTFHTGGVFTGEVAESILAPHGGIIDYNIKSEGKKIYTKYKEKAFFTIKEKKIILYENKINKSMLTVPKYCILFTKPKEKIYEKQIIGEICDWDQEKEEEKNNIKKIEVKAAISGQIYFQNKVKKKEKTRVVWILNGNRSVYYKTQQNLSLLPKVRKIKQQKMTKNESKHKIKDVKYKITINIFGIKLKKIKTKKNENYVIQGITRGKKEIFIKKLKTEKFIKTKNKQIKLGQFLSKNQNINNKFKNNYSNQVIQRKKNCILVRKTNPYLIPKKARINKINYSYIKKTNVLFSTIYTQQKTEDIVQGLPKIEQLLEARKTFNLEIIKDNPHDKLQKNFEKFKKIYNNAVATRKSFEKLQTILIYKIQKVYQSQGVKIADKHLEIIIKQMTSRVIVMTKGDSKLITGEIVELNKAEKINKKIKHKIKYEPILLGISKLSLSSQSFISEACFQETTRVLCRSAIEGRIDWLFGLKENLILGNLIPSGTGYENIKNI